VTEQVHTAETVPVEPVKDIHAHWNDLVMHVIRKSKGLKAEDTVELPEGETGHYVKYALDRFGRLSTGKGHGRRKPRLKPHQAAGNRLMGALFVNYLSTIFAANQMMSPAPQGLTMEQQKKAQAYAQAKAEEIMSAPAKLKAKAARKRQKLARRINAGVIAGNRDRSSHSEANAISLAFYRRTRRPEQAAV
jgi:hypothetical protein